MGWPRWLGEWELIADDDLSYRLWMAWLRRQCGSIHRFVATDPTRWLPAAYIADGALPGGWSGDASAFSLSGDRAEVTLTVPPDIIVTPGDLIGFRWASGTKFACVEAMAGDIASGSPATVTVPVVPAVHDAVPGGATAYLYKAGCIMRLTPQTEEPALGVFGGGNGKLVGLQEIVP